LKIAVSGKGGVGKTLVAGTISRLLARDQYRVLAVDADPALNLSYSLGIPSDVAAKIVPLTNNEDFIRERAGVGSQIEDTTGFQNFFKLNPKVDDVAEKYGVIGPDGVKLLVIGTIGFGGSGCMCPANALIRAILRHISLKSDEAVVMDMEAGLEHLGRGTTRGFQLLLCVVEPGTQSIETARKIKNLAKDIGINRVAVVANKITSHEDEAFIKKSVSELGLDLIGSIPFDDSIRRADIEQVAPIDYSENTPAIMAIQELKEKIEEYYK
jgi:CO dehydrogenase maturation factor